MTFPTFSMRELIEAGVHFGHKTKRWNPAMAPYIYGARNDTHIIDLGQTVPMLHRALKAARDTAANNGKILFVGTKRQASDIVAEAAASCGQYYINQRWLGGLLTNWETIQGSIKRLRKLEQQLEGEAIGLTKKEILGLSRQRDKLEKSLGGIKDMGGQPDLMFIIDTCKEDLAIKEAQKLGIPTIAIVDTNAEIEGITYPIPGNDDATRAIRLYCQLIADAISDGRQQAPQPAPVAKLQPEPEAAPKEKQADKAEKADEEPKKAKSTTKKGAMAEAGKKAAAKSEPAKEDKKAEAVEEKPKKAPAKKAAAKKDKADAKADTKASAKEAKAASSDEETKAKKAS